MGINFQSAHATEVFAQARAKHIEEKLRERFGSSLPLGRPGNYFCIRDQMGWSWWQKLQTLASERLGEAACPNIRALDAWLAVYVDSEMNVRELLPLPRGANSQDSVGTVVHAQPGPFARLLRRLGLKRPSAQDTTVPPQVMEVLEKMRTEFGARPGEDGALQVGNLRAVLAEAEALLRTLGIDPVEPAIEALRRSYSDDEARCDDDPAIQCLCHLWLTGMHSLEQGQPLWLIK